MKKRFLKTLVFALVVALAATTMAFAAVPSDIEGQTYEKVVTDLMDKGIITGDNDGLFHPNDKLTRAQACVIVVKAMNPESSEVVGTATQKVPKSGFSDMRGYGWADGYVGYAVSKGITKGIGGNKFAPADKVTTEEMVTMLLRAAGYSDKSLEGTWPENYMKKAEEVKLFADMGEVEKLPNPATKIAAAHLTYNALDEIKKANSEKAGENTDSNSGEFKPGVTKLTFGTGSFNDNMTAYSGKKISKDVVVYTYGKQSDYKSGMTLSTDKSNYKLDTVNKYKNTQTPCFYNMADGEIVTMVIPMDVGFSGRVYGVINSVSSMLNGSGDKVSVINSLSAGKEVNWLTKDSSITGLPSSDAEFLKGDIYEMVTKNGAVKEMYKASDSGHHEDFAELTDSTFTQKVESYKDGVVTLQSGSTKFEVANNASIYVLSDDGDEYTVGKQSDIKKDVKIRAYNILEDKGMASVVVIQK
ncbi:S-layer homology domain-containing protein [Anaerovorax odorimutans]|uniref:S-layer homology domain-containing protein n=1 Tax=Anaerovorax odorimutans TaxID=109327 RepID=UPI0004052065|nr:S-layer homology domain-containing protein [Anaerovorax odorimutans]